MKKLSTPLPADSALTLRESQTSVPDLDLPDAPDFISRRTPLSLEQMLPLLEERRRWFPLSAAAIEARGRRRVTEEFIL